MCTELGELMNGVLTESVLQKKQTAIQQLYILKFMDTFIDIIILVQLSVVMCNAVSELSQPVDSQPPSTFFEETTAFLIVYIAFDVIQNASLPDRSTWWFAASSQALLRLSSKAE